MRTPRPTLEQVRAALREEMLRLARSAERRRRDALRQARRHLEGARRVVGDLGAPGPVVLGLVETALAELSAGEMSAPGNPEAIPPAGWKPDAPPCDDAPRRAFLRREAAAKLAGVSVRTIDRWVEGGLRSHRVGRCRLIDPRDLEAFIRDRGKRGGLPAGDTTA